MRLKLVLLLILTFSLFLIVSCKSTDKDQNQDQNQASGDIPTGNYLWSDKTDLTIYLTEGFPTNYVVDVREHVETLTGRFPRARIAQEGDKSDEPHVLIIGKTKDEVSRRAYNLLDSLTAGEAEISGYVIYGYNGSVALAYTDNYVADDLIEKFFELFNSTVAYFEDGILFRKTDLTTTLIRNERDAEWDTRFAALSDKLPDDTVKALRSLYNSFYDEDIYIWLANLYDPDTGGFYYSNSARNTEGYLPDIESTMQALVFIDQSGLTQEYEKGYVSALPREMKDKMISFARNLQSSEDGYFYHPQWGTYISISRRGRDLGWATNLLSSFGTRPYYDTANGYKGIRGAPGQNTLLPTSLTGQLRKSSIVGVSKVSAISATPDHLKNETAFLNYLKELDFENDSYVVGNQVNAEKGQIETAGLSQVFIDYINSIQRSDNGLWEKEVNYNSVNGLMKISQTVATFGGSLRYIDQAFESTVKIALMTDPAPTNVCSIYNMWNVMSNLIGMEEASGNTENAARIRQIAIDNSAELIRITREKMAPFKKNDGGFSYGVDYTSSTSQGVSVSVLYTPESDVNSTTIMTNTILSSIYSTFGVSFIPLYYKEDGEYFLNTLNDMGTIIKDADDGTGRETVAGFTSEEIDTFFVKSHYFSSENKQVSATTPEEDIIEPNPNFVPITRYSVVDDPVNEKNKVLKVECDISGEIANGSTILTPSKSTYEGHCHIFESRIYYDYIANKGDATQIFFEDSQGKDLVAFRLNYNPEAGNLSIIQHNKDGSGRDTVKGISLPYKEWFTLRIEVYQTGVAETTMARISVGIGDKEPICLTEINAYCQLALTKAISKVNVAHQRTNSSVAYFDDISYQKTEDKFVPTFMTKDYMELPNTSADFEDGFIISGNVLSYDENDHMFGSTEASCSGSSVIYSVTEDPSGAANKVLKVATNGKGTLSVRTEAAITNEDATGDVYVFETRLYALPSSTKIHPTQIAFVDSTGKEHVKFILTLNNSDGTISLMDYNSISGNKWTPLVTISPNTWGNIRLEYYKSETESENHVKLYASEGDDPLKLVYTYSNAVEYVSENPLVSVYLNHQTNTSATIYYDDMSFSRTDKEYVYEAPEAFVPSNPIVPENSGIVNGTFTFETVPVGSATFSTSAYGWSMGVDAGYTKEIVEDTVYGKISRVYKLDPGTLNNEIKLYATPVKVTADGATAYKMALDLKILPDTYATGCEYEFLLYSSTAVFQIGMKLNSGTLEFWNKANATEKCSISGTNYNNVSFLVVGDKGELTAILCLNGEYAAAFTTPITETEFAFTEMTYFRIRAKSTDNTLFIDNIYVGFTDEAVPDIPETPDGTDTPGSEDGNNDNSSDTDSGENSEGSIYDKEGWIK